jgi:hypothetical protein
MAASILLLLGALMLVVTIPNQASPTEAVPQSYAHVHADGHVHWHQPTAPAAPVPAAGTPFSFGAAGDYSFSGDAQAVMTSMGSSGLAFAIALGDTTYGATNESNWCNFFESKVGDGKVLLIAGNHDTGESGGGNINTLREHCNFGIAATSTGDYAKEYYFDYPIDGPLARFILISPDLEFVVDGGEHYDYNVGTPRYNWTREAIDGARAAGIPWVIVGMHKNCISNGAKGCEIGEALQDLLLSKRVDLVLQGHDHNYQRSKQLACADDNNYRPECVADSDHSHDHGAGEVINIAGTGGQGLYGTGGAPDEGYFTAWQNNTKGFLHVVVSATALNVSFKNVVGSFTDSYEIKYGVAPSPDFTLTRSPASVSFVAGQSAFATIALQPTGNFTGSASLTTSSDPAAVSGSCAPSSITVGQTSTCTLSGSTAGSYTVTITGTNGTLVHTTTVAVTVAPPEPGPDTTPPIVTITSPLDQSTLITTSVTVTGSASDNVALESVELSMDATTWTPVSGTNSWSATVTFSPGSHKIYVRALDTAGNQDVVVITVFVEESAAPPPGKEPTAIPIETPFGLGVLVVLGTALAPSLLVFAAVLLLRRRRDTSKEPDGKEEPESPEKGETPDPPTS